MQISADDFMKLSENIKNGNATEEEKLLFLKELNASLEFVNKNLPPLKDENKS